MKLISYLWAFLLPCAACSRLSSPEPIPVSSPESPGVFTTQSLAKLFSELPIGTEQVREVHDAVSASSAQGYDEEYTLQKLLTAPGCGVGGEATKAASYACPLRELLAQRLHEQCATKSGASAEALLSELSSSDFQLYWPYCEDWDGKQAPLITFDPGYDASSNYGYVLRQDGDGIHIVDSVYVDENVARSRPVWVLNRNSDAGFTPLELFSSTRPETEAERMAPASHTRRLMLKSLKMLRHYDSWFAGASEFVVKAGSVEGFTASTEAELKLYRPSVTDFVIVVKRKYLGQELPYDCILLSEVTSQLDKIAFLLTEDDGGTRTNWKCEAIVKVNSKSYGFTVDLPYNEKDDIVWRGQLPLTFFQEEDEVTGRFGDVILTFELL
ncbi:MAG: hypothetical protein J5871_06890 [Bacteroidales bacterium]|nr:hypothetical protein [Bacteroidales bacterium]